MQMGRVDCLCNRVEPFAALFWALNNVCYLSTYVCPTPTLLYSTHWLVARRGNLRPCRFPSTGQRSKHCPDSLRNIWTVNMIFFAFFLSASRLFYFFMVPSSALPFWPLAFCAKEMVRPTSQIGTQLRIQLKFFFSHFPQKEG